jgi:pimeloyl-ACP methyl ester carboxylesterase
MPTITVAGVDLFVRDTSAGHPDDRPTVLLLHGWPDTGDLWRHQVTPLCAAGYRVVVPDLRGFGASGKPADLAAYASPALVGDVLGVLDALGIERAHLVGHDWGAAIGWLTAALAPDRVHTLTALSVGHPGAWSGTGYRQREKSWYMLLFQFPGIAERWLSDNNFRHLREWSRHPEIEPVVDRLADPAALTASLALYRAGLPPSTLVDPPPPVPSVAAPTLGVWSRHDPHLTEERMTASEHHVTGPWRYERIDAAGHWIPLEAPDRLNDLLLEFLAQHTRQRLDR